ncbi:aspartic proteinase Asp1-like [Coffea eugenioides]|uniref:aspartic proteinase Asp1-like n=1 Tax=Coffea eugenioides TaxID=49369 RepID=UPI000F60EA24|nr:aspartic proteinase Asp1-like [Coffea eugenioides]
MHEEKSPRKIPFLQGFLCLLVVLLASFPSCSFAASRSSATKKKASASSVIFPVSGNVYPKGYYQVTVNIGQPPKPYFLDIDTGSDLTWLQCDAPCTKCTPAPHSPYKPNKNLVTCKDPLCVSLHGPTSHQCEPLDQCDYQVEYADRGSSLGVLVQDLFPLRFTNGSISAPRLAFGCGYNQEIPGPNPPYTDGVLGLGTGKSSILSQLNGLGLTRNVIGHCLSVQGGGFLFFGDDLVPSSGIVWTSLSSNSLEKHYSVGPADLFFGGQASGVKGQSIVFDSGSTYNYFNSQAYNAVVSLLKKDINGRKQLQDAVDDKSLPICWKAPKPFKSILDVKSYFKPLALVFTSAKNVQFQLQPEAYLIVTKQGNACLGILNGTEVGIGKFNVIGDISLQDKLVIYDNEKQQIGWASANCNRLPNVDRDYSEGYYQPYSANFNILEESCPATLWLH